jgi:hypothetical protein
MWEGKHFKIYKSSILDLHIKYFLSFQKYENVIGNDLYNGTKAVPQNLAIYYFSKSFF